MNESVADAVTYLRTFAADVGVALNDIEATLKGPINRGTRFAFFKRVEGLSAAHTEFLLAAGAIGQELYKQRGEE